MKKEQQEEKEMIESNYTCDISGICSGRDCPKYFECNKEEAKEQQESFIQELKEKRKKIEKEIKRDKIINDILLALIVIFNYVVVIFNLKNFSYITNVTLLVLSAYMLAYRVKED